MFFWHLWGCTEFTMGSPAANVTSHIFVELLLTTCLSAIRQVILHYCQCLRLFPRTEHLIVNDYMSKIHQLHNYTPTQLRCFDKAFTYPIFLSFTLQKIVLWTPSSSVKKTLLLVLHIYTAHSQSSAGKRDTNLKYRKNFSSLKHVFSGSHMKLCAPPK